MKLMARSLTFASAGVLLLVLSSCGTLKAYLGNELPANQTALIQGSSRFPLHLIQILSIDNIITASGKDKVRVLPGHHSLTVELYQSYVISHITLQGNVSVDAQAGLVYTITGRLVKGDAVFDITGAPEANASPSG